MGPLPHGTAYLDLLQNNVVKPELQLFVGIVSCRNELGRVFEMEDERPSQPRHTSLAQVGDYLFEHGDAPVPATCAVPTGHVAVTQDRSMVWLDIGSYHTVE